MASSYHLFICLFRQRPCLFASPYLQGSYSHIYLYIKLCTCLSAVLRISLYMNHYLPANMSIRDSVDLSVFYAPSHSLLS